MQHPATESMVYSANRFKHFSQILSTFFSALQHNPFLLL